MTSNYKRWIAAAGPLVMACTVCAQGHVTDVATMQVDGGLAVKIKGSDLPAPKTRWDDGALVLNFGTTKLARKGKTWRPNDGGIKAVSYAKVGHTVDVAIRPMDAKQPQIVKMEDGWVVYFEEEFPETIQTFGIVSSVEKSPLKQQKVKNSVAKKVEPKIVAPQSMQAKWVATPTKEPFTNNRVSLNFVNTDIVQILKALALQGNVNIAMGPDVVGKVTVNLDNVTVREALDLVTTLGGVRYAQTGSTFVVASTGRFAEMMGSMNGSSAISETRVIPLFSREGTQIKAAILKSMPANTPMGKYELTLPSEKVNVEQTTALTPQSTDPKDGGDKGNGNNAKIDSKSTDSNMKDDYVVVIGTPSRLDAIEGAVRGLDTQICTALNIKVGKTQGITRKVYEPQGIFAVDLVKALVGETNKEFNGVQLYATPTSSASKQAIVLSGREDDVDRCMNMLIELDTTPDAAQTNYQIVGLKYIQPGFALNQLMKEVPGLKVSILPPPIDPRVGIDYNELTHANGAKSGGGDDNGGGATSPQNGGGNTGGGGDQGSGSNGAGSGGNSGNGGQLGSGGTNSSDVVKISAKSNSIPMKLLLRGTPNQINSAQAYLNAVDMAPKQVAVELRVMELSKEDALKVGLDWSVLTGGTLKSIRVNQGIGDAGSAGGIGGSLGFKGGGTATIAGALDALTTKNNVLARPSILVNDGVPTNIFVGDEVRYIKSIQATQNGTTVVTDQIDVGVDFNVIARVGDGGNINVDLAPTMKVLQGFTAVPGGGSLPQTSRRSAATQMTIKSGETIAIGGLIQDQDRKSYGGIPILKDLPIIGRLFGRTDNRKVRSEVVFFVTVKEVTPEDRDGAAHPREAEKNNTQWPGGGPNGKKG